MHNYYSLLDLAVFSAICGGYHLEPQKNHLEPQKKHFEPQKKVLQTSTYRDYNKINNK
jgi:hypothetical protein